MTRDQRVEIAQRIGHPVTTNLGVSHRITWRSPAALKTIPQNLIGASDLLVISGDDVLSIVAGKEPEIVELVRTAYQTHGSGNTSLPHSSFLLFPDNPTDRIIALPAYLGGPFNSAGVKWVSSFPENINHGIDRASAILVLNSMTTGRPRAILEGSIISAKRTAASAALAAQLLQVKQSTVVGFVGCGIINFEIARFLRYTCPTVKTFLLFDLDRDRTCAFQEKCEGEFGGVEVHVISSVETILRRSTLVSFATTAATPHVQSLKACATDTVILHISLRDLSPSAILSSDNVVDDLDHVCRAQTSIHLAEQKTGNRQFVRCSFADILNGHAAPRSTDRCITIFSPFGLGILDVALGEFVLAGALAEGKGHIVPSFLPDSWSNPKNKIRGG